MAGPKERIYDEQIDIPALRALCEAATPGPWTTPTAPRLQGAISAVIDGRERQVAAIDGQAPMFDLRAGQDEVARANGAFIAAARSALPALLDALEAARKERDEAIADGVLSQRVCDLSNERDQLRAQLAKVYAEGALATARAEIERLRAALAEACDLALDAERGLGVSSAVESLREVALLAAGARGPGALRPRASRQRCNGNHARAIGADGLGVLYSEARAQREPKCDGASNTPGIECDARVLRAAGWREEDETQCIACGLYPMRLAEFTVCSNCERCKACGCDQEPHESALEVVPESVPPQAAPPGAIPAMWTDEDGAGPDGIVLVIEHWPPPEIAEALSHPDHRVFLVVHAEAGEAYVSKIGSVFGGAIQLHHESVADLHRELGEWLAAHPVTAGDEVSGG
ncbi:MAG: ead/Ea22-like family protein [Kofleriaceae bacterium]